MPNPAEADWADAIVDRFTERAEAVKQSAMPPLEGAARLLWRQQRQLDYQDFAMMSDAAATLNDGVLTLTVDLRPQTPVTLPTDGNKITPKMLDSKADLQALVKDSKRFLTVVETIEPIVRPPQRRGIRLAHGYLV